MSLTNVLIYLYTLLKSFYFFNSGMIQICDVFLILAFIIELMGMLKNGKESKLISKNIFYIIFLFFVILINLFWYALTKDFRMILCTSFYIYNFFVIILFSTKINEKKFLHNMKNCLFGGLLFQLLIFVFGIGQYEYVVSRYKGTLNDPNQFAFFCLTSFFLIFIINKSESKNRDIITTLSYLISIFLIYESASTGILLSLVIFSAYYLLYNLLKKIKNKKNKLKAKKITIVIVFAILILLISNYFGVISISKFNNTIANSDIYERVLGKIDISKSSGENSGLLYDRGYDKILKHPAYIFVGAGEGAFYRFPDCVDNEIHASLPSILFYYGIFPTLFLLYWIKTKIKYIPKELYGLYIALGVESFTLLNQRQSFFWIIIIFGLLFYKKPGENS